MMYIYTYKRDAHSQKCTHKHIQACKHMHTHILTYAINTMCARAYIYAHTYTH